MPKGSVARQVLGENHLSVLTADIQLPDAVIATRAGSDSSWRSHILRNASDAQWKVQTEDPTLVKRQDADLIRFDAAIAPGLHLSDAGMSFDRLVKTELCIDALSAVSRAGPLGAGALSGKAYLFDNVLRWRFLSGRPSFRALVADDFREFMRWLAAGGSVPGLDELDHLSRGEADDVSSVSLLNAPGPLQATLGRDPDELARQVADRGAGRLLGVSTLRGYAGVWNWLWRASATGVLTGDRLLFDPNSGCDQGAIAGRLGRPAKRTATLSPSQFIRVLRSALDWIVAEGPTLIALLASDDCERVGESQGQALAKRVRRLLAACATLIGGLAARRGGEVASLKAGCVSSGPRGLSLSIYIEKTDQAIRRVLIPAVIGMVVGVLEKLTAPTRAASGEAWLFKVLVPGVPQAVELDFSHDLADFAVACGLHEGEHALVEPLLSHQLRRGFAMTFYHAYRLGSIQALRRMLRHRDEESTYVYVTEAMNGAMIKGTDEARVAFARSTAGCEPAVAKLLLTELRRLEGRLGMGRSLDADRFENATLTLLRAWRQTSDGSAAPSGPPVVARASASIRIGSQSGLDLAGPGALLASVRAYAAGVAP